MEFKSHAKDAKKFNPFAYNLPAMLAANVYWDSGYWDADGNHILPVNIHNLRGSISIEWPDGSILCAPHWK